MVIAGKLICIGCSYSYNYRAHQNSIAFACSIQKVYAGRAVGQDEKSTASCRYMGSERGGNLLTW